MLFFVLVIIQVVIFGILVLFLRTILTRNISKATSQLHQLNEDYSEKLEEAKKRQADADKYYDEMVRKTKIDAETQKVQILKDAHQEEDIIVKEARRQGEDIILQANKNRESLIKEFDTRVELEAIDKACLFTNEILSGQIKKTVHEMWVQEILGSGLGDLTRLNLPEDIKEAEIVSAYPLSDKDKSAIQKKILNETKKDIHLKDSVDPALVAGFKVTLGSVVIDASLRMKVTELARNAKYNPNK